MTASVVRLGRPVVYSVLFEVVGSPTLQGDRYWTGCCLEYGFLSFALGLESVLETMRDDIASAAQARRPMKDPQESIWWSDFTKAWEAETRPDTIVVGKVHAHMYPNHTVVFGMTHIRGMTADAL